MPTSPALQSPSSSGGKAQEDEERIMEEMRRRPDLLDTLNLITRGRKKQQASWDELATEFDSTTEVLKKVWLKARQSGEMKRDKEPTPTPSETRPRSARLSLIESREPTRRSLRCQSIDKTISLASTTTLSTLSAFDMHRLTQQPFAAPQRLDSADNSCASSLCSSPRPEPKSKQQQQQQRPKSRVRSLCAISESVANSNPNLDLDLSLLASAATDSSTLEPKHQERAQVQVQMPKPKSKSKSKSKSKVKVSDAAAEREEVEVLERKLEVTRNEEEEEEQEREKEDKDVEVGDGSEEQGQSGGDELAADEDGQEACATAATSTSLARYLETTFPTNNAKQTRPLRLSEPVQTPLNTQPATTNANNSRRLPCNRELRPNNDKSNKTNNNNSGGGGSGKMTTLNPEDPTRHFFESMGLTVMGFPQHLQASVKVQVSNIVHELEYELHSPRGVDHAVENTVAVAS